MVTIKDIAELAGVSRRTVIQLLNNRGSVHPEKARKVLEAAKALNYTPNFAGKTLALAKKQLKFGYIFFGCASSNPFFGDIVKGIESRAAEFNEYGVSVDIRYAAINKPESQVEAINELMAKGIDGLAITPIDHPLVRERIKSLTDSGIPVVAANTDITGSGRTCYVGSDYFKSGETAAGIVNMICGGKASVGIIIGSPQILCHSERVAGFTRRIDDEYTDIKIIATEINHDDDVLSYVATNHLLDEHPETDVLLLAGGGGDGSCRAVEDRGLNSKLKIVGYDLTEEQRLRIESGTISATITQEPFVQGAKPLDILLDYAGLGIKPDKEYYYTEIGIKIKESL